MVDIVSFGADPQAFLSALRGGEPLDAARVAIVVAHPDDETLAAGGQLQRLTGVGLVHVTDGAPRTEADARGRGFATRQAYAGARQRELAAAMRLAGVGPDRLKRLGIADQGAALSLVEIARSLTELLPAAEIVLTHAYEGGHPDHDATAFAVHAAARLMRRGGAAVPAIVEMPFYRAGLAGWRRQEFAPWPGLAETTLQLSPEQRRLKKSMIAAYVTQQRMLANFPVALERFRPAPDYDFTALPNGGRLLYERHDWGMSGHRWRLLAAEALKRLGLRAAR